MNTFIFGRKTFLKKFTGIATIAVFLFQFAAPLATTAHAVEPVIEGNYTLVLECTSDVGDYCTHLQHLMTITSHDPLVGTGSNAGSGQTWTITEGTITATDVQFTITYNEGIGEENAPYDVVFTGTRDPATGSMEGTAVSTKHATTEDTTDYNQTFNWYTSEYPDQPTEDQPTDDTSSTDLMTCAVVSNTNDLVEESGTLAKEVSFIHSAWAPVLGDAHWIWSSMTVQNPTDDETKTFKKTFTSEGTTGAILHIAADNGYKVVIQGHTVVDKLDQETSYKDTNTEYTDGIDVANFLTNGFNTMEITVKNFAMNEGTTESNPAGLMYKLDLSAEHCANTPSGGAANGSITIYSYTCPDDTVVSRAANGYGKTIPEGCTPEVGARYGYTQDVDGYKPDIYNPDTNSYEPDPAGLGGSPHPDLDGPYVGSATGDDETPFALTGADGVSYNDGLSRHYRYTIVKVGADNKKLPNSAVLGLYCDVDTDAANDNMDVTYINPQTTGDGVVYNSNCIVYNRVAREADPELDPVQVHVYKYLKATDGSESLIPEDSTITRFPMYSTWQEPGKDTKEGYYTLGIHNGGAPDKYGSITANMLAHSWYTTHEQTTDELSTGLVLPIGAECKSGYYRLVGYRTGDTLSDAQSAPLVSDAATFTDLTTDGYAIVVNESCDAPVDTQEPQTADQPQTDTKPTSSTRGTSGSVGNRAQSGVVLGESATADQNEELPASCSEYLHSYIKYGGKNDSADVTRLQAFLNKYLGAKLVVNGEYNKETYEATKAFQVKEAGQVLSPWKSTKGGINDDGTGYVYKTTKRWINMLNCPELNIPMPTLK